MAARRTKRASASFDAAYAPVPSVASRCAPDSSPARHAAASGPSAPGLSVAEFDDTATAAGSRPAPRAPRKPSRNATAPK